VQQTKNTFEIALFATLGVMTFVLIWIGNSKMVIFKVVTPEIQVQYIDE